MDMQDDTPEENVIQMKRCPRCSVPIRRSLRYGNIIKQQLRDIEKVKMIMRQKADQGLSAKLTQLQDRVDLMSGVREDYLNVWKLLFTKVKNGAMAAKLENRILLMERIRSLNARIREIPDLPKDVCNENNFDGMYHDSRLTKFRYSLFFLASHLTVLSAVFFPSRAPWVDAANSLDYARYFLLKEIRLKKDAFEARAV